VTKTLRIFVIACLTCVAATAALGQQQMPVQQRALSAEKLLSLGDLYFRNNDTTDVADTYYRQAIRNAPNSTTAGHAQYNRGSYWFQKFYVMREQFSRHDSYALSAAEGEYYNFVAGIAKRTNTLDLLSDAEFYLALVYLQQNKRDYAVGWLNRMLSEAVKTDQRVYVYKVVWSSKSNDIIDRTVDAAQLASYSRDVIAKESDVNKVILAIKRWCQRQ
jgi:tetratricopeptide (TPR) repeat protein